MSGASPSPLPSLLSLLSIALEIGSHLLPLEEVDPLNPARGYGVVALQAPPEYAFPAFSCSKTHLLAVIYILHTHTGTCLSLT